MDFVVYILYSPNTGKSYVGFTTNLIVRFRSHNNFGNGYTSKYRPWLVAHVEFYANKEDASSREKYFKSGSGHYLKENFIKVFVEG
jgi:putative endonuclease